MSKLERLLGEFAAHEPVETTNPSLNQAAVALCLVPDPDRLLLILRAERASDPWSGQLALPGGRREAQDSDLLHTAIRETREEVGFTPCPVSRPVQLNDLAPSTPTLPRIVVRPWLFVLRDTPQLSAGVEVAATIWIPLSLLAEHDSLGEHVVNARGMEMKVQGYKLSMGLLWGMTERIVTPVIRSWLEL